MLSYSTQVSTPTSASTVAYSGFNDDGTSFTPKAIFAVCTLSIANNTIYGNGAICAGMATSSKQVAVGYYSLDAVSHDGDCGGSHADGYLIHMVDYTGTVVLSGTIDSFDTDGITITYDVAPATAYKLNLYAIGGTDVNAYIKQITAPGSTGDQSYTGFGFTSDAFVTLGTLFTATPTSTSASEGNFGFGLCDSSFNQVSQGGYSGGGPTNYQRIYSGSSYVQQSAAGTISQRMTISAIGGDGFTGTWNTSAASGPVLFVMGLENVSAHVGVLAARTSTGTSAVSSASFEPKGLITLGCNIQTSATTSTNNNQSIGFCDSLVANGIVAGSHSGGTKNSNAKRSANTGKVIRIHDASLLKEASLQSYDSNGGTFNFTTADATAMDIGFMFLGGDEPVSSTPKTRMLMGVGL